VLIFAEISLPNRCLALNVYSGFVIRSDGGEIPTQLDPTAPVIETGSYRSQLMTETDPVFETLHLKELKTAGSAVYRNMPTTGVGKLELREFDSR
jgi:hypothetical protein